jgi:hypothetical protein
MDVAKCTRLLALAGRCLREPPSRRLDAEIYCAFLDEVDLNTFGTDRLLTAASDGDVLLANLLLPENVLTIAKEPRQVRSIALMAMVAAYRSESPSRALVMIG